MRALVLLVAYCLCAGVERAHADSQAEDNWEELALQADDAKQVVIAPDDTRLGFTGRFSNTIDGVRYFTWSGSQISFMIKGNANQATIEIKPSTTLGTAFPGLVAGDRLGVIVNGTMRSIIEATKPGSYPIATDLKPGVHDFVIWKLSEAGVDKPVGSHNGDCGFQGLKLPAGAELMPASSHPNVIHGGSSRHLRFIGDSDTAGFCCDGSPTDQFGPAMSNVKKENNYYSWSAQLARDFGARYTAQAISGIGVMDHVDSKTAKSPAVLSLARYIDNTNGFTPGLHTHDTVPNAVVVLLGPNDFNDLNIKWPRKMREHTKEFRDDMKAMFEKLKKTYPTGSAARRLLGRDKSDGSPAAKQAAASSKTPKFIVVCGGSGDGWTGGSCKALQKFQKEWNSEHSGSHPMYFMSIHESTWHYLNQSPKAGDYLGCAAHYNKKGHRALADELRPQLARILGWDTELNSQKPRNWCESHSDCRKWWASKKNKKPKNSFDRV